MQNFKEFVDFNGGPGVQHIALSTNDIIKTVEALETRGVEFLTIPNSYYSQLKEKLNKAAIIVQEDIEKVSVCTVPSVESCVVRNTVEYFSPFMLPVPYTVGHTRT